MCCDVLSSCLVVQLSSCSVFSNSVVQLFEWSVFSVQLFSCSVHLFSCQLSVVSCSSFVVALAMDACGSQAVASLLPEKGGSKGVHPGALPTRTDSHQARARIKTHKRVHAPRTLYRRTEDEKIPRIKNQEPRTKNQDTGYRFRCSSWRAPVVRRGGGRPAPGGLEYVLSLGP